MIQKTASSSQFMYVAYQGDEGQNQTITIRAETANEAEDLDLVTSQVKNAFKSCLLGHWLRSENSEAAQCFPELARSRFICCLSGFVIRISKQGWQAFEVTFTSDDLNEAVVKQMEIQPSEQVPLGWPTFVNLPI